MHIRIVYGVGLHHESTSDAKLYFGNKPYHNKMAVWWRENSENGENLLNFSIYV